MSQSSDVPVLCCAPAASRFECTLAAAGIRAAWIHVAGELDMDSAPHLERALRAAQLRARLIVIDTRAVSFIDCGGLRVILAANEGADWGVPRVILAPGRTVERLLELTGVHGRIWTFELATSEPRPELGLVPQPEDAGEPPKASKLGRWSHSPDRRSRQRRGNPSDPLRVDQA